MIILISSKVSSANIQASLGKPEYSYFFLMKDFLPALERVGTVIQVQSPDEIDSLHASYTAQGESVIFISFSPPHQTPLNLSCPTVTLFAWEFDSLPSVAWDSNPQNDWRYVFAHSHGAIATSREAALLVEQAMGDDFPVTSLPAPVWDRFAAIGSINSTSTSGEREFPFTGIVIDSPLLGLSADGLVRKAEETPIQETVMPQPPAGHFQAKPLLEAWRLSMTLVKDWWKEIRHSTDSNDAILASPQRQVTPEVPQHIKVRGIVYTTVLNPADGRKNWIDLITAFCWAFKHSDETTLIVKMTHHDLEFYRVALMTLLSRLAPFRCRVLVLHGFLEGEHYQGLIRASDFYVNASSGEGLCLPLMEFLASGKPAIAPDHTAMADYVNERLAFVLKHSLEPTCWPHDPTGMLFTHRHRLNWQSLMQAFRSSHQMARDNPSQYQEMSREAYQQMRYFASVEQVSKPLERFLQQVLDTEGCLSGVKA
jgi:glycosyltransferase involved in cell wall biosynthesis